MDKVLHSSAKMDWGTPWDFFHPLDREFHFDVDVCATFENTKVRSFFITPEADGLKTPWSFPTKGFTKGFTGGRTTAWCNPPYGRGLKKWVAKAWAEKQNGVTTVMLVPARTDTKWWAIFWDHEWNCMRETTDEVRFIKGRIRFQGAPSSAPFPSALIVLRGVGGL